MKFIWLTYLQPKIDYCSQLWGPTENILNSFTKKINSFKSLTYWERLDRLNISSIGRRIKRYRCIYVWKIIQGHTMNCNIKWDYTPDRGILCYIPKVGNYAKTLHANSFQYVGPQTFNSLT